MGEKLKAEKMGLENKIKDEIDLTNRIYEKIDKNKPYSLKKLEKFVNLANKDFEGIWSGWYKGETPPKLEVDLIFVFEDLNEVIDDALIIGTEVKYFRDLKSRNFYEGLGQALSYSVFGFDGLSLWHLFSREVEDNKIKNFATATKEIIEKFNLPFFYICGKIIEEEELKIKYFNTGFYEIELKSIADWMLNTIREKRNPLLFENKFSLPNFEEIKQRNCSDSSYHRLYLLLSNPDFKTVRNRRGVVKKIIDC